ncbi:CPBP family intramembrane glutamic endopeptidase [Streptococcus sobrinus]|uniref:CPBP family intramembrane glutamic endopeptidase n=1 Tax=Streptococcus sobrinus TaxID=1310 RepID=UPI0002EDF0BA|nr:CPBP family intramembrane glutamic endopeptidase [Streptococcus sobrinus]
MKKIMKWWYITQYFVFIIIFAFANITAGNIDIERLLISLVLILTMLMGASLTLLEKRLTKLILVFRWIEALFYLVVSSTIYSFLGQRLHSLPLVLVLALYILVTLLPVIYNLLSVFTPLVNRLLFSYIWFLWTPPMVALTRQKLGNQFLQDLFSSGLWDVLAYVIFALFLMRQLGFGSCDWGPIKKLSVWTVSLIGLFVLYFSFLNAFSIDQNWLKALFVFDFSDFKPTLPLTFAALRAGVGEEIVCRYIFLLSLLHFWRNHKYQVPLAIFISSALFGLIHFGNLIKGQDLVATTSQVIFATAVGIAFSVIYLYTGKLWTVILFHAIIDLLAFSSSGSSTMAAMSVGDLLTPQDVYLFLFSSLFSIWMLTGQRKRLIYANVGQLFNPSNSKI